MMKASVSALAQFGGPRLFSSYRTTGQLANPDPEAFFRRARQVFENRLLTNNGPLVQELESRLALLHGTRACVSFANASLGIILSLAALAGSRSGYVVLPAFSFRGLPHLIRWAGLEPRYCDVEPLGHTLCPRSLAGALDTDVVAVLAVNNVNALCDIKAIETVTARHGVPLLLDSVYAVGGKWHDGRPVGTRGRAEVFSLHATKLLNGFEGGYLTTDDELLAERLQQMRNFGFVTGREAEVMGMNAKLNELHAALALSSLDHMETILKGNWLRFDAYQRYFADVPGISLVDYSGAPRNHGLVLVELTADWPFTCDETVRILRAENALVRPYYSPPLHHLDALLTSRPALPVSERLSNTIIQMAVGELTSTDDIAALADLFRFLHSHAIDIRARLTTESGT